MLESIEVSLKVVGPVTAVYSIEAGDLYVERVQLGPADITRLLSDEAMEEITAEVEAQFTRANA